MGPWLRSHGRNYTPDAEAIAENGFNGAVASQPRKGMGSRFTTTSASSFNGAVASQPRKVPPAARTALTSPASMGPWLRSHGRNYTPDAEAIAENGFNGAVASQPRKGMGSRFTTTSASSFNGAVASQPRKVPPAARTALTSPASMGPWLRSHGRVVLLIRRLQPKAASMGPWLRSHGRCHHPPPIV